MASSELVPVASSVQSHRDAVEYVGFRVDGQAVVLNLSEHRRLSLKRSLDLVNPRPVLRGTNMTCRVPVTNGASSECLSRTIPMYITGKYNPCIMQLTDDQFRQYQRGGDVVTDGLESSVNPGWITSHIRVPTGLAGVLLQQFLTPYATSNRFPVCV